MKPSSGRFRNDIGHCWSKDLRAALNRCNLTPKAFDRRSSMHDVSSRWTTLTERATCVYVFSSNRSFMADATVGRSYDDVLWLAERATCPYVVSFSTSIWCIRRLCLRPRRLTDCRIDKHRALLKSLQALHVEHNTQRYMKTRYNQSTRPDHHCLQCPPACFARASYGLL